MQPSPCQPAMVYAEPKQEKRESIVPLLSFITYSPTQNVLEHVGQQQRQFFFLSLMQLLHCQNTEEMRRAKDMLRQRVVPLAPSLHAEQEGSEEFHAKMHEITMPSYRIEALPMQNKASKKPKPVQPEVSTAKPQEFQAPKPLKLGPLSAKAQASQAVSFRTEQEKRLFVETQEKLAYVISDYARGDAQVASEIVQDFQSRLSAQSYKPNDLMATLLIVIEDHHYGKSPSASGPRPIPPLLRAPVPIALKKAAQASSQTCLGSVREMLYYYFTRHPHEFSPLLAAAIGMPPGSETEEEGLLDALAACLAKEGGFSLANRILAQLKRKKRMDTKKCLSELGYLYDGKSKRLVVGKRTCGKLLEAKMIIDFLISTAGKKSFGH